MPTDEIIWDQTPEELEDWINRVLNPKNSSTVTGIDTSQIEE